MNPLIVLKVLDLAMLGFSAWQKYEDAKAANDRMFGEVNALRTKLLTGEMTEAEAAAQIEAMTQEITEKRRKSFEALPKPTRFDHGAGS